MQNGARLSRPDTEQSFGCTRRMISFRMKVRAISSTAEIDDLERAIVASADSTVGDLRTLFAATNGIEFLAQLKFRKAGRDPLSARPLNLIEQVNQTFTYLASCDALRYLIAHHADRVPFVIHLGTAAGPDIESTDRSIVAEVFAATHPGSNQKLLKDLRKLRACAPAAHRYLFYSCPGEHRVQISQLQPEVTVVALGLWTRCITG